MTNLTTQEQQDVLKAMMAARSRFNLETAATRQDGEIVVNDLDTFQDTNSNTINQSIQLPQRTILTSQEKTIIFILVAAARYLQGGEALEVLQACLTEYIKIRNGG